MNYPQSHFDVETYPYFRMNIRGTWDWIRTRTDNQRFPTTFRNTRDCSPCRRWQSRWSCRHRWSGNTLDSLQARPWNLLFLKVEKNTYEFFEFEIDLKFFIILFFCYFSLWDFKNSKFHQLQKKQIEKRDEERERDGERERERRSSRSARK